MGPVSRSFLRTLKGVQYGALEDRHGWMVPVTEVGGEADGAAAVAAAMTVAGAER